jgi:hypothetical protein
LHISTSWGSDRQKRRHNNRSRAYVSGLGVTRHSVTYATFFRWLFFPLAEICWRPPRGFSSGGQAGRCGCRNKTGAAAFAAALTKKKGPDARCGRALISIKPERAPEKSRNTLKNHSMKPMVPGAGIEPARLAAGDFESPPETSTGAASGPIFGAWSL